MNDCTIDAINCILEYITSAHTLNNIMVVNKRFNKIASKHFVTSFMKNIIIRTYSSGRVILVDMNHFFVKRNRVTPIKFIKYIDLRKYYCLQVYYKLIFESLNDCLIKLANKIMLFDAEIFINSLDEKNTVQ